jgi:hypothetical protein
MCIDVVYGLLGKRTGERENKTKHKIIVIYIGEKYVFSKFDKDK